MLTFFLWSERLRSYSRVPQAILFETENSDEYEVKINNRLFGFYLPYLSQMPINIQGQPESTLATPDVGHAHNWVVCRTIDKQVRTDVSLGVTEVHVLKRWG